MSTPDLHDPFCLPLHVRPNGVELTGAEGRPVEVIARAPDEVFAKKIDELRRRHGIDPADDGPRLSGVPD